MIRIIAKRYAKALVDLSAEQKIVDKVRADLAAFAEAVNIDPNLQKLFASPVFTPEDKKGVIKDLAAKLKLQPVTVRFLEYLAETGRIRYVRDVITAFEELLAERENRAMARLTTAVDVSKTDLADIQKSLESLTGKSVDLDARVEPELIGGAKAQIGSMIYDGTIKNQLTKMREQLVK